ncbi:hypothetical protein [Halomontanus rarus]|uniref:hypothetical protein n=1 Tax=Halomontanus rarus TaxID=3034020 RepID=UPI00307C899A
MSANIIEFGGPQNETPRVLVALVVFIPLNAILGVVYALMYGLSIAMVLAFQAIFSAVAVIASPLPGPGVWSTYAKFFSALRGELVRVGSGALGGVLSNIAHGHWAIAVPEVKLV